MSVVRNSDVPAIEPTPGRRVQFFHGDEHGFGPVTVALSTGMPGTPGGGGRALEHRHQCGELFVVVDGQGTYSVGDGEMIANPGDIFCVPAQTWHSFRSTGEVPLRHVGVFPSGHVESELNRSALT
jgi:mannose-6-phosphate isomerase-like protein (cupin superfamily)